MQSVNLDAALAALGLVFNSTRTVTMQTGSGIYALISRKNARSRRGQ